MEVASYHLIDPVLIRIGPIAVRWYGIMYLIGFLVGYWVIKSELRRRNGPIAVSEASDLLFYLIVGLLAGARIGYVLFYNLPSYADAPWEVLAIWHGGMSFHGGLLGMLVAGAVFAKRRKASFLELADIGALAAPIGLMLGRIGNFINGELYGRVTSVPWGVVFPTGGHLPRHPSQLYEAVLEGPVLFGLLWWVRKKTSKNGVILGLFLAGYGISRFVVEFFREPDPQLGFVLMGLTMGQVLCMYMILGGLLLLSYCAVRRNSSSDGRQDREVMGGGNR
jgi:phosphatidylglycerol:prolipoprotein diacylglycerol transferase